MSAMRFQCSATGDGRGVLLVFSSDTHSMTVIVPAENGEAILSALKLEFAKAGGIALAMLAHSPLEGLNGSSKTTHDANGAKGNES